MLVNFFKAHDVGHLKEALHYCLGHHKANPESRLFSVVRGWLVSGARAPRGLWFTSTPS
jgi:hypothetical protein